MRTRIVLALAAGAIAASLLAGGQPTASKDVLECREVRIVDEAGRVRGILGMRERGVALELFDSGGDGLAALVVIDGDRTIMGGLGLGARSVASDQASRGGAWLRDGQWPLTIGRDINGELFVNQTALRPPVGTFSRLTAAGREVIGGRDWDRLRAAKEAKPER